MLLKKERVQEISRIRDQNQRWKDEVAKQILQKQLEKQKQKEAQKQRERIQQEKIKQYQQQINQRVRGGSTSRRNDESQIQLKASSVLKPIIKQQKVKSYSSKKKITMNQQQQEISLFPEIVQQEIPLIQISNKKQKFVQKQAQKQQISSHIAVQPAVRKRRKSTSKRRHDTIESRKITQQSNNNQIESLQTQNKKLKQELHKQNSTIQNLMKMLRLQDGIQNIIKQAQSIVQGKQLGFTQYIKVDQNNSVDQSPTKALFPSLDFKSSPIISKFNKSAARKANPNSTSDIK